MSISRALQRCSSYRRSWAAFLKDIIPPQVWRESNRQIGQDPRRRWSARLLILALIMMGWSRCQTLQERFQQAQRALIGLAEKRRRPGGTYVGLIKAARKLGSEGLRQWWKMLRPIVARRLPEEQNDDWPHPVLAVDGSRFEAPRTRSNQQALGRAGRHKSGPQWWVTWLVQLPGLLLWDWRQGPGASSERHHLRQMLDDLPPQALIVGDAGYVGYPLMSALQQRQQPFLIRCGSNVTLLLPGTRQQLRQSGSDRLVYLWPQGHRREKPLELRLICVGSKQKRVYLLTNVLESSRLSRGQAGRLYRQRWGVEVGYRHLKQTLERRRLLCRVAAAGALELAGNVLALAMLLLHAAVVQGRHAAKISVAAALRVLRQAMEAVAHGRRAALWLLVSAVGDDYDRRHGKESRQWPRKKKEKPPGSPKCRRMSQSEERRIISLLGPSHAAVG